MTEKIYFRPPSLVIRQRVSMQALAQDFLAQKRIAIVGVTRDEKGWGRTLYDEFKKRVAIKLLRRGMATDDLIRRFAGGVKSLLIVEELDDFIEQHVKALGIPCRGRDVVPGIMELSVDRLAGSRALLDGRPLPAAAPSCRGRPAKGRPCGA